MNQTNNPRRLTRSRDDRFVGGVAAGMAKYFNIDPVFVRAGFLISVAFGGIGVLAYMILLAMVPIDGDPEEPASSPTGSKRFWVIAGTVVLGCLALASIDNGGLGGWFFGIGPGPLFGVLIWILALGGVFWLVREATRGDKAESGAFGRVPSPPGTPRSGPPPSVPPAAAAAKSPDYETGEKTELLPTEELSGTLDDETVTMADAPTQNAPATPPLTPTGTAAQRNLKDDGPSTIGRIMTWFAIGVSSLIVFSILAVLSAGITAIFGAVPMAALVILLGIGLVTAATKDRRQLASWLLAAALVIAVPMAAISIADLRIEGSYGDATEEPRVIGDIPDDGYEMAAGAMTIDLRKYPFRDGETVRLPVKSGMGASRVIVPDRVCVAGKVEGKAGLADVRGVEASGIGVDRSFVAGSGTAPQLELDVEFKLGYFEVVDVTDWQKYGPRDPGDGPWDGNWEKRRDGDLTQAASRERALTACLPKRQEPEADGKGGSGEKPEGSATSGKGDSPPA